MGSISVIVSPLASGRRYGVRSASFLFVVILAEIEGLAYLAIGLLAGRPELFLAVQSALFPASWLVATVSAGTVFWRARNWPRRTQNDAEVVRSFQSSNWRQRIGAV